MGAAMGAAMGAVQKRKWIAWGGNSNVGVIVQDPH